eukprot:scaffold122969_cov52-Phaeocystis_antarctica.AAC.2
MPPTPRPAEMTRPAYQAFATVQYTRMREPMSLTSPSSCSSSSSSAGVGRTSRRTPSRFWMHDGETHASLRSCALRFGVDFRGFTVRFPYWSSPPSFDELSRSVSVDRRPLPVSLSVVGSACSSSRRQACFRGTRASWSPSS